MLCKVRPVIELRPDGPRTVGFLHTAQVHVDTFEALSRELIPSPARSTGGSGRSGDSQTGRNRGAGARRRRWPPFGTPGGRVRGGPLHLLNARRGRGRAVRRRSGSDSDRPADAAPGRHSRPSDRRSSRRSARYRRADYTCPRPEEAAGAEPGVGWRLRWWTAHGMPSAAETRRTTAPASRRRRERSRATSVLAQASMEPAAALLGRARDARC